MFLTRSSTGLDDPDDFQLPRLRLVWGFMGLTDVEAVVATTLPTGHEPVEALLGRASEAAFQAGAAA